MNIGILGGTGRMGTGLAQGYARAGHAVVLGSRDAEKASKAAAQLGGSVQDQLLENTGASGAAQRDEARRAGVWRRRGG